MSFCSKNKNKLLVLNNIHKPETLSPLGINVMIHTRYIPVLGIGPFYNVGKCFGA